ncbi:MAG TPA: PAS domain-containing protein, partial [Acholeplasmataceae bacterium]|nr:PAS domain-containing protein [Acholeplasmataceae bacterium]
AKNTLNECISLVYKLNDEEGITYCEYLNAKLHVLENNYKLAKQSFQDIFKNLNQLSDDYLSIANEYISLLIDMDLYDEAYRVSIRYLKSVEKSNDLYIKKDYYKNYLKIFILRNKSVREDLKQLLKAIEVLEHEIEKTDQNLINETSEDDKNLEVLSRIRVLVAKVEKTINITNLALKNESERECLLEFSKSIEELIDFDEALYVVLTKGDLEIMPVFINNFNMVKTYNYKKQRLYEREFPFNNLSGTIVEMLITTNHEVALDFNETPIPVKNLITEKSYAEEGVKTILAIPLNMEKEMFGCAVFFSDETSLIDQENSLNLKIATKLLEAKLVSLFYQENLRAQKAIMQAAVAELKEGIYFMEPETRKLLLSEELSGFLQLETNVSKSDYEAYINEDDLKIYANVDKFVENGEPYYLEYRIRIGEKEVLISDKARPYISKDGIIKFYIGVIGKLGNEVLLSDEETGIILKEEDFEKHFAELSEKTHDLEFRCTFAKFILEDKDLKGSIYERVINYIYGIIKEHFSDKTFLLNDGGFISVLEINDQRVIDRKIKTILGIADKG